MFEMEYIIGVLLAFARISTFLFMMPFLRSRSIPLLAKITIALSLSLLGGHEMAKVPVDDLLTLSVYVGIQVTIGLILAYITEMVFAAAQMAGGVIDIDMGFSASQVFDPGGGQRITVISNLFYLLFAVVFISLGGFDSLMYAIVYSFDYISIDIVVERNIWFEFILMVFTYMLNMTIQIALPLMASMFIVNFMLLIIGKMSPQMNILMNMFAIKICIGFVFLFLTLPFIADIFAVMNDDLRDFHMQAIKLLMK